MPASYWVCAAITAVSAFVSLGYSAAGFRSSAGGAGGGYQYALARSTALAVIALIAFFTSSFAFVACVAIAMVITQGLDAVVGARLRQRLKTVGPATTALVNVAALLWLLLVAR